MSLTSFRVPTAINQFNPNLGKDADGSGSESEFDLDSAMSAILETAGVGAEAMQAIMSSLRDLDGDALVQTALGGGNNELDMSLLLDDVQFKEVLDAAVLGGTIDQAALDRIANAAASYSPSNVDDLADGDDSGMFVTASLVSLSAAALAAYAF
jgi:hypothetical protein